MIKIFDYNKYILDINFRKFKSNEVASMEYMFGANS